MKPKGPETDSQLQIALAPRRKLRVLAANHQRPVCPNQHSRAVIAQSQANLQERLQPAPLLAFPLQLAQLCQCPPNRDPFVPGQALPVDQKYNRAARCGAQPISGEVMALRRGHDRHPRRRNRAGFADCGNRCTHSPRKSAGRGRPCPISERDKCRCLLHPSAG